MARAHDIYLSSTLSDLEPEVEAVRQLLGDRGYGVKRSYSADDRPVLESCLADVATARIYVGIVGLRYGHCPPEQERAQPPLSITELELRHALSLGRPCYLFVKSDQARTYRPIDIDRYTGENDAGARIQAFRAELGRHVRPAMFDDVAALRDAVFEKLPAFERDLDASTPAPSRTSDLTALVRHLATLSAARVVADLLQGRIGTDELDAIAADDAHTRAAVQALLEAHRAGSSPWLRALTGEILRRRPDAGAPLVIEHAFGSAPPGIPAPALLAGLRHAEGAARLYAIDELRHLAAGSDLEHTRLAILGLGYLGEELVVRAIADREGFGHDGLTGPDDYIDDKLAGAIGQAGLASFLHREGMLNSGLALLDRAFAVRPAAQISTSRYEEMLHRLRPGLAQPLLRHAAQVQPRARAYALGVLFGVTGRLPAHAAADALALARADPAFEQIGDAAVASAAGGSSGPLPAELASLPAAALMLAAGWGRSIALGADVQAMLDDEDAPGYAKACAAWAAGRLSVHDARPYAERLRRLTTDPHALLRAHGWLGLALGGHAPDAEALRRAFDEASDTQAQVILGIAGACLGDAGLAEAGLVAAGRAGEPIWRLWHAWRHLYTDFESACRSQLGAPGRFIAQMLAQGHV